MDSGSTLTKTSSDYSVTKRRNWVMEMMLSGHYPVDIREQYVEKYKLSEKSYEADVTHVNNVLAQQGYYEQEAIIQRHSARYDHLYKKALEMGDVRGSLQALKGLEDLYKLHKTTGLNSASLTVNNTQNINLPSMSIDEIRNLLGKGTINIDPVEE